MKNRNVQFWLLLVFALVSCLQLQARTGVQIISFRTSPLTNVIANEHITVAFEFSHPELLSVKKSQVSPSRLKRHGDKIEIRDKEEDEEDLLVSFVGTSFLFCWFPLLFHFRGFFSVKTFYNKTLIDTGDFMPYKGSRYLFVCAIII